jgi:hypothetical protein
MANYKLEGELLEACSCGAPCPCWIGEDPDQGTCDAFLFYRIDRGTVKGVDVSGLCIGGVAHIPGNILKGNWKLALYVDDRASAKQKEALVDAWSGKLGGPLADLAELIGEVVGVYSAPIEFRLSQGKGTLKVGNVVDAEMAPYTDKNGHPTTIRDTAFSTIPGSPAYVAKASHNKVNLSQHGMHWAFYGRNAIQGSFHFAA